MAVGQSRPWPLAERPLRSLGVGLGLVLGGLGLGLLPAPLAAVVGLGSLTALLVVVRPVWGLVALAFAAPFLSAWRLAGGLTLTEGLVGALAAGLFLGIGARRAPGLVLTPWVLPVVAMALGTLWGVSLAPDLAPAFLEVLRWVELGTVAIITAPIATTTCPRLRPIRPSPARDALACRAWRPAAPRYVPPRCALPSPSPPPCRGRARPSFRRTPCCPDRRLPLDRG